MLNRIISVNLGANMSAGVHARAKGCVIQRCQNKNPREELGSGDVSDVTHRKRGMRISDLRKSS